MFNKKKLREITLLVCKQYGRKETMFVINSAIFECDHPGAVANCAVLDAMIAWARSIYEDPGWKAELILSIRDTLRAITFGQLKLPVIDAMIDAIRDLSNGVILDRLETIRRNTGCPTATTGGEF